MHLPATVCTADNAVTPSRYAVVRATPVPATVLRLYCILCEDEMELIYSGSPGNHHHEHMCRGCGSIAVMDVAYPAISFDAQPERVRNDAPPTLAT